MAKGQATHERLIESGLRYASEHGLAAVSIAPLAAEAGLKKSSFFAHFPSKEQLQVSLLEAAATRFGDLVLVPALSVPVGLRRLRRLFALWLEWTHKARLAGDIFVSASLEFAESAGPVRDRLRSLQRIWIQALEGYVQDAVNTKDLPDNADTQQLAFEMIGFYLVHEWARRLLRDDAAAARAKSAMERLLSSPPLHDARWRGRSQAPARRKSKE
jgi:AcrR family transcriptional regulator